MYFVFWGGFLEGLLRNPARLETRQPRRPQSCRDSAPGRDCEMQMWTFLVAVAIGGRGVDANLRILQVIGSPKSKFFTWFSFS
ncbi:hypothetical protein Taro_029691, partial [Colocasia esculenta]|nr:hypothetical protein [Colocasia esculenta]